MTHAVYKVTGVRNYRGHEQGEEFVARIDPLAEKRAVDRGAIQVLERLIPTLPEGFTLPRAWMSGLEENDE